MNTLEFIKEHRLVSISRQVYGEELLECARRLIKGGIRCLEITFDQASSTNLKDTPSSITMIKKELGDEICVGAGTVMTLDQAKAAKDAGADFALAPNTDVNVIHEIKRLDMVAVPGAFSPSEIAIAWNEGADIVKIFPIAQLGVPYLKAVRGPINHIPLMAVGGVSEENVADFMKNGCCSAGVGSNIINRKRAQARDFDAVEKAAAGFVKAIKNI